MYCEQLTRWSDVRLERLSARSGVQLVDTHVASGAPAQLAALGVHCARANRLPGLLLLHLLLF